MGSRSAPLDLMSSLARATTSAAIAPAVVSAITPPVSASASRATSAPGASRRPSSRKEDAAILRVLQAPTFYRACGRPRRTATPSSQRGRCHTACPAGTDVLSCLRTTEENRNALLAVVVLRYTIIFAFDLPDL